MQIQCDCGKFQAELVCFPQNSPGRLACYCDDCQNYLKKIQREDRLDSFGGTEVVPVYPAEFKFVKGQENLRCNRLSKNGLNRWSTTCCNSPIANTKPNFPWVGLFHSVYTTKDPSYLENLGPIKSRIMGQYAKRNPPFKVSKKLSIKDIIVVLPFLLKGMIFKKYKNSPFFNDDGTTPISVPQIL
ncbi:MAG: hypothetical protein KDD40_05260 [Bdellovibrionales bacterium]|nr:hypothetical protein [Bdellovibrionales bacterium]